MYAVIKTGGKQYRVETGDVIEVELASISAAKKPKVQFDEVLMVADKGAVKVGDPTLPGAKVSAAVVDEVRGPKLIVFKKKRRKGYKRRRGHRQDLLRVRIEKISA